MARNLFLLLGCVAMSVLIAGCSSEGTAEGGPTPNTAATSTGDTKAGTANQLSINPDYKK